MQPEEPVSHCSVQAEYNDTATQQQTFLHTSAQCHITHAHMYTCPCAHARMHARTRTHVHTRTRTRTHTHTYTHTHTHTLGGICSDHKLQEEGWVPGCPCPHPIHWRCWQGGHLNYRRVVSTPPTLFVFVVALSLSCCYRVKCWSKIGSYSI